MNRVQIFALFLCTTASALTIDAPVFEKGKEVVLPGSASFDYLTVDANARRVYVAHALKIEVVDADKGEKIGTVEGVEGAHGCVVVAELKRGFATAGKKNALVAFDTETFKVLREIPTGEGPDAVLYIASLKEVWTMNHRAGTVTCVDASTYEVKATIEVGGTLEFATEWPAKGLVFVNAEDKHDVVAIDTKTHHVVVRHPLAPAEEPTGMAIDVKNGLLFCGCSSKLAVMDASSGKVLTALAIGSGCDAVAFDAESRLVFASCGDGTTTIVRAVDAKTFDIVGKIDTVAGARTCTLDEKTHALWVGSSSRADKHVKLLVFTPAKQN